MKKILHKIDPGTKHKTRKNSEVINRNLYNFTEDNEIFLIHVLYSFSSVKCKGK
jgi:hypothetical protein